MSLGLPEDRDGGYRLEGACINAGVKVDGAAGWEKEKGMHLDVDSVNEDVVSRAVGHCEA
jgi:hypothetical protein